jgi:hypothetical protein
MSTYKIGEILVSQRETEVETIFGRKEIIPKGNKIIITAHRLGHHIRNGMKQPLKKDDVVKGYDTEGLAEYLFTCMKSHLPMDDMMYDYDLTEENIKEVIEEALDEIF